MSEAEPLPSPNALPNQHKQGNSPAKLQAPRGSEQISCNQTVGKSQEAGVMTNKNTCPKCGVAIPADAPQGLCPKCVLLGVVAPTESGLPPTATAEVPSLERVAAAFPQLEILQLLGRGGMGFVFKARQPHLDRFVALKLLPDKLARDPHFAERFSREARMLARLNHPGIVSIFDFGQAGEFYFLLMEYVDGVNLHQAMQAGRFSPAAALAVVPKICEALQYAHEQGVLHRDIKPANILLDTKGRIKIADFGIAKLVGEAKPDFNLTATGATVGTPQYMAPEQLEKPGTVDHRADIYSLGVVFYEMLTGELPIGRFSPPSQRTPVDPRVDEVVMRALEKEREKRYQSAGEVKTKVEHLTAEGASPARAATAAFDPAEDFILCPPRLPRMAKAIIIYSLVVAPMLWIVGLFMFAPLPDHPLVGFVAGAVNLVSAGGEFLVLLLLAVGGWKLRALRPSAVTWVKFSLWFHLCWIVLMMAGQFWVGVLEVELLPETPTPPMHVGDGVVLAVALFSLAFEISALVWLRRHGAFLKSVCPTRAGSGPQGTLVTPPVAAPADRRRVLKWAAFSMLVCAVVLVILVGALSRALDYFTVTDREVTATTAVVAAPVTGDSAPWIQFTFTAVELREVKGKWWLAIDYLDKVNGNCQKAFPWESNIPGHRPETRSSEFAVDVADPLAPRHQRVEYLLPDSIQREQLEQLRSNVEKALKQQTIRLELGQEKLLFEFGSSSDTALKAWIKVVSLE